MFDHKEYLIAARGDSWPSSDALVLGPQGAPIAVIREEPWPEVLQRQWPDGPRGRPWLWRLLGAGANPRRSRIVVRRYDDGGALLRLHRRQPLFNDAVGIFDDKDLRLGYARWKFKGAGPRDEFDLIRVGQPESAEVRRTAADVYRVAEKGGREWGAVTISRGEVGCEATAPCRVSLSGESPDGWRNGELLMAAALMLYLPV